MHEDVIVLDATIEPRGEHNYDFAVPLPLDHILVVSRTFLPLNFYGLRDEIEDEQGQLLCGAPFGVEALSNQDILRWLDVQLRTLRPRLPRPD